MTNDPDTTRGPSESTITMTLIEQLEELDKEFTDIMPDYQVGMKVNDKPAFKLVGSLPTILTHLKAAQQLREDVEGMASETSYCNCKECKTDPCEIAGKIEEDMWRKQCDQALAKYDEAIGV